MLGSHLLEKHIVGDRHVGVTQMQTKCLGDIRKVNKNSRLTKIQGGQKCRRFGGEAVRTKIKRGKGI